MSTVPVMNSILDESQKLNPSGKIMLVELDFSSFMGDIDGAYRRLHYCPIPHTPAEIIAAGQDETKLTPKQITWDGQPYDLWAFQVEGLSMTTDQQAKPTLTVHNLNGVVSALCSRWDDLVKAKVRIIQTYVRYLDGQPEANPAEAYVQTYYIDRKTAANAETVAFELASPGDLQNLMIPTRTITSICTWAARGQYKTGDGCDYVPSSYGNRMFDENGNPVTDPSLDRCGGCLSDCRLRFQTDPLPFGGFPATSLLRS